MHLLIRSRITKNECAGGSSTLLILLIKRILDVSRNSLNFSLLLEIKLDILKISKLSFLINASTNDFCSSDILFFDSLLLILIICARERIVGKSFSALSQRSKK